ncbi:VIR protein [Plasmodium vivax]|uniref:VIR protein n=1 Tax=Plasmodium vivax TaxID=5855 RepID=A0A1G4EAP4_PLAVI|nr:VIR protein [Plasmodium vivax]VUZ93440.1 PIR protein [Plasmodium vivax]
MSCNRIPTEESYEFFENIVKYIEKAKSAEIDAPSPKAQRECKSFMDSYGSDFTSKETAKIICEQFIKLYDSLLTGLKCISERDTDYGKCSKFLNYWVNFKFEDNVQYIEDPVCNIYNFLESRITDSNDNMLILEFIYDINKDEFYKMRILYRLYEKYIELDNILKEKTKVDKESLYSLSIGCCPDYIKASYMCSDDNKNKNHEFCKKLDTFKSKYANLDNKVVGDGYDFSDYFIKLSECPNTKIIATAVTGTVVGLIPLLGVLYKFTPMGQMFRSKKGILNNGIIYNDEEMTKMSLMEQENEPLKFQQGSYNIKYQSL